MLHTEYGSFDGDSWENICQLIFKSKYGERGYQEMPASPGDFGIEGFVKEDGIAIQCYCPDHDYIHAELYEKQRNKITVDLNKLKKNQVELKKRLGKVKIKKWIFLTPVNLNNNLLKHACSKQHEVRLWNLDILDEGFVVDVQDAAFYAKEINDIRLSSGDKVSFIGALNKLPDVNDATDYEMNIDRKNKFRCVGEKGGVDSRKLERLNTITTNNWFDGDTLLKKIEKNGSEIYFKLQQCFSQFEIEVDELCITWSGSPNELVDKVKSELSRRISEAVPELDYTDVYKLANSITSRWIALCPLEIYE